MLLPVVLGADSAGGAGAGVRCSMAWRGVPRSDKDNHEVCPCPDKK